MKVPVSYGPRQKYLAIIDQYLKSQNQEGAGKQPIAIALPRMSFEIKDMIYDSARKLPKLQRFTAAGSNPDARNYQYTPVPYDMHLTLSIMTKNAEDGPKIYEQILPYFGPEFTVSANLIPEMGVLRDIPVVFNGMRTIDEYQGEYEDRRSLTWELDFTMKVYFFGPVYTSKPIKKIDVGIYNTNDVNTMPDTDPTIAIQIVPGLTADGQPTTDIAETIPYTQINKNDPWDFITTVTEYFGNE